LNNSGGTTAGAITWVLIIVFVIFPVISVIFDKHAAAVKGQEIKDAVDITNIALYNSLDDTVLSRDSIDFMQDEALEIYTGLLARNLRLTPDLMPLEDSIAEGQVEIISLVLYTSGFPITCPNGMTITRPAIHSCISVPVWPVMYRTFLLNLMGREYIEMVVYVDSELPVDN
jgi:hypothetical protein